MSTKMWRRIVSENVVGLYILGAVALGVVAAASLALDGGLARRAGAVMKQQSAEAPWTQAIRAIDEALAGGDVSAATQIWSEAYNAAVRSRRWDGLLVVGDARVRIDQAAGPGRASAAKARDTYLAALFRARQEGSLEGVLQSAEAFDSLGDAEVASEALRIAEAVAGRHPTPAVLARLAALRESRGAPFANTPREREVLVAEP
jgi:hypothetical protein